MYCIITTVPVAFYWDDNAINANFI